MLCSCAAAGTEDGYIIIWDFETRGMAKLINGHRCDEIINDRVSDDLIKSHSNS
jgi:hypothetical protein